MNNEEEGKMIRINHLLALCDTIDDYEEFQENLINFSNGVFDSKSYYKLAKLSNNMNVFGSNKVKKFYYDNSYVIDKINSYTDLYRFLYFNYEDAWHLRESSDFLFFHNYILNNREKIDEILAVVSKIKELDFKELIFLENSDFTNQEYSFYNTPVVYGGVVYLDNMVAIPNYQNSVVKYKSMDSNYKMVLNSVYDGFSSGKIFVNSLLFDKERLPDELNRKSLFDKFNSLKEEQIDDINKIKNAVDLNIGIYDLIKQFNSTKNIIEELDGVVGKDKMMEILPKIEDYIYQLNSISNSYDKEVVNSDSITEEKLEEEKKLYLKRRFYDRIDID